MYVFIEGSNFPAGIFTTLDKRMDRKIFIKWNFK